LSLDGFWIEPLPSANCSGMDQAVDDRNQVAVAGSEVCSNLAMAVNLSYYPPKPVRTSNRHRQIASIAHEIKIPLASIKGVADAFP
jgi:nitrogen-specific signal transduction histidine kinase